MQRLGAQAAKIVRPGTNTSSFSAIQIMGLVEKGKRSPRPPEKSSSIRPLYIILYHAYITILNGKKTVEFPSPPKKKYNQIGGKSHIDPSSGCLLAPPTYTKLY